MYRQRLRRVCFAGYIALLTISVGSSVFGASRATKEQIAEMAKGKEDLLDSPTTNYVAIASLFIRTGSKTRDELIGKFKPQLAKAQNDEDRAAINYLIGESYYWGGMLELQRTRKPETVVTLGEDVTLAFLAAWDAVRKADRSKNVDQLQVHIVGRYNQLLATKICGSNLSTNLKQQVIARYIDSFTESELHSSAWSVAARGNIFRNLGIQDRLLAEISPTVPKEAEEVVRAMKRAWAAGATNAAVRLAAALQEEHKDYFGAALGLQEEVFAIYDTCGDVRAVACSLLMAERWPKAWLDVYRVSVKHNPQLPLEQRRAYVDNYLNQSDEKEKKQLGSYRAAADVFLASGDADLAYEYAMKALASTELVPHLCETAYLWRIVAQAALRNGENGKAVDAYRKALAYAEYLGTAAEMFRNEMSEAEARAKAGDRNEKQVVH